MSEKTTFEMLAGYHVNGNLRRGVKYLQDGVMHLSEGPAVVGTENGQQWYKSALLISNHGSDLVEALMNGRRVCGPITFRRVSGEDEVSRLIDSGSDGAIVYDKGAGRVARVILDRDNARYHRSMEEMLPYNFLSEDGSVPLYGEDGFNTGSRTRTALDISRGIHDGEAHVEIDASMIKHTIYSSLGFGPVVHIGERDMEIFFFRYDPSNKGPFIDDDHSIVGVLRPYSLEDGRFMQQGEVSPVVVSEEGRLVDRSGTPVLEAYAGSRVEDSTGTLSIRAPVPLGGLRGLAGLVRDF